MKNNQNILWLTFIFFLSFSFVGCEKNLETYMAKDNIYFWDALYQSQSVIPRDSTTVSFGYVPIDKKDSLYNIPVNALGNVMAIDREFKVKVLSSSTAQAGTHYDFMDSKFVIPANSIRGYIRLKLYRLPEMQKETFNISLELIQNDNFSIDLNPRVVSKKEISMSRHTISFNDILTKPKAWLDGYLGPFSRKKMLLMAEINGIENLSDLDDYTITSISKLVFYGNFTQRYLNEMEAQGKTIYEEDEKTKMVMGSEVQ